MEKEMSQEEMRKEFEARKAEWDSFMKDLKDNPDETITKAELEKVINFVFENINGLAQMSAAMMQNMDALNHNFNQIANIITGGKAGAVNSKTKSGIILP